MKIMRLKIQNYRGIKALDAKIPEHGVIATGGNGRGKTSVLRAIRDALAAQDIGPHAIRLGADKAEILVDLDDVSVRRVISRKGGSTLRIETHAGDIKAKPQTWLTELLGTAPLDPIDFFLGDAKARRKIILGALPVKLTAAQLPEAARADASPQLLALHGLEACAELHRVFYDRRAAANAAVKQHAAHVAEIESSVAQMAAQVPPGTPTIDVARAEADHAHAETVRLDERAQRATAQAARFAATRVKIERLHSEAATLRTPTGAVPSAGDLKNIETRAADARSLVAHLEEDVRKARANADTIAAAAREMADRREHANARESAAIVNERQATALAETIASAEDVAPTAEELRAAAAALAATRNAVATAGLAEQLKELRLQLDGCTADTREAEARAAALTLVVDALAKTVPAALIAASDGIQGLGITGEAITLDGVRLDGLSGGEQMRFAVDIARRANAKAKILVVDGLERISPDTLAEFVTYATRDGWQLIASRVDRGDMVLEAIAAEPEK